MSKPSDEKPGVHVVALRADLQLTLRLLMRNYTSLQTQYILKESMISPDHTLLDKRMRLVDRLWDIYERTCILFPYPETIQNAKAKLLVIDQSGMKQMLRALDVFYPDPDLYSCLDDDDMDYILNNVDELKEKIHEASRAVFTVDEIRRGGVKI